eukprot:snap_masked-scaffold_5-processed-gene-7.30-mRNA-1 protein AED:1.00 eAED:1.00 QI:0/0/0/0/1/1/2/0/150
MDLFIKTLTCRSYTVHVGNDATVLDLKLCIQNAISIYEQTICVHRQRILENNESLTNYNIQAGDTIHAVLGNRKAKNLIVFVQITGQKMYSEVYYSHWQLRSILRRALLPKKYKIYFKGKEVHEDLTLFDIGICDCSVVEVVPQQSRRWM